MVAFIFMVIFLLIALAFFVRGRITVDGKKYNAWYAGIPFALIFIIVFFSSCFATIQARSVGIETAYGHVDGLLTSGLHFKAPWKQVHDFPATIQTVRLTNQQNQADTEGGPVTVRLGNQNTATVNVTVQWSINTADRKAVEDLYANYRTFDHIQPNLFIPQLQHSLLQPFEGYNPLNNVTVDAQGNSSVNVPLNSLEAQAQDILQQGLGEGITIKSYAINLVQYDQATQDKLNAYTAAIADTRIATQQEQTATATAAANNTLASSQGTSNAGVVEQNCLTETERLLDAGHALPQGWSCLGNGSQNVVDVNK